jgi:hypothetical protein
MPMHVLSYPSTQNHTARPRQCELCNPIIFQVFFSNFEDGQLIDNVWDYELDYFAFDFADNGYGKHVAALKGDVDIDDALSQCSSDRVLLCV